MADKVGGFISKLQFNNGETVDTYQNLRDIFVANLDTAARLSICKPADNIARNAAKQHPIHYAAFTEKYGKWLSDNYKKAFGENIIVNNLFGGKIPLCIGETVKLNGIEDLSNENFKAVWNDPLLKHSNIMSSLFHKQVVLCESDSDCKMYSIIESHLKRKENKYSETLYIHCGGKHRMAKIIKALKMLNVDTKLIPDIDVLNDEKVFRDIVEAVGLEWSTISAKYKTIVSNLHSSKESIKRSDAAVIIEQILNSSQNALLSGKEIDAIRDALKTVSKWSALKEYGIPAIPRGDARTAFDSMNSMLREKRIFIVPVGELECFIKSVGGHGPDWVNTVLEKYPDLDDPVYAEIKEFVSSMGI